MYDDYLEETTISFVKKYFGFGFGAKKDDGNEEKTVLANNVTENCDNKSIDDKLAVLNAAAAINDGGDENVEMSDEERLADEQLNSLLKEAIEKQKEHELEKLKRAASQRAEYDGINEAISNVNFHLTLFFLLIILTALNLPSVISWAKNYRYKTIIHFVLTIMI